MLWCRLISRWFCAIECVPKGTPKGLYVVDIRQSIAGLTLNILSYLRA